MTSSDPSYRVRLRGDALLTLPRWNKGTAFTLEERKAFGLTGRLPHRVNTLDEQCERAYDQLRSRETPIAKNTFLQSLKDQNWVLYYSLLGRHLRELVPIIYTPTEAEAIANYSHLFRRSEGLYLTFPDQDTMEEDFLEQTNGRDMDLIVCSDAEAILGIGDQGVGGIGISAAKSVIYTLIGGVDPHRALPVVLDVGTDNQDLLSDPLYVGWPNRRIRGPEYDAFIDKFVQLVKKHYPNSLLHFEDFGVSNANKILKRYREVHSVFNDDMWVLFLLQQHA
ncbi:NAD-dependent malic enzyme, mitochondrial [Paramarasmius palmivorus]|uniref:NAD-dependent malic enzyme, mitochondrial n=1 Tax=Paramarasmius palmivorus TaxID=297713 RepID=A0AAW0DDV5_9AGAR